MISIFCQFSIVNVNLFVDMTNLNFSLLGVDYQIIWKFVVLFLTKSNWTMSIVSNKLIKLINLIVTASHDQSHVTTSPSGTLHTHTYIDYATVSNIEDN